jgi:hypothetical protein
MNNKRLKISSQLQEKPSYLKWGIDRLAVRFKCSTKLMKAILEELQIVRKDYLEKLKN